MIKITWLHPIASGTVENLLSYNISVVEGTFYDTLDDSATVYVITDLAPGAIYTIQVCVCLCLCLCVYMCVRVCVRAHVCVHVCTSVCTHPSVCLSLYTYVCVHLRSTLLLLY